FDSLGQRQIGSRTARKRSKPHGRSSWSAESRRFACTNPCLLHVCVSHLSALAIITAREARTAGRPQPPLQRADEGDRVIGFRPRAGQGLFRGTKSRSRCEG